MSEERSIPKFAVVEDSEKRFVLETRGSRYAGAAVFSALGLPFLLVALFAESFVARVITGVVAVFLYGVAAYVFIDRERWVLDKPSRRLVYARRLKPSGNATIGADQIAATEVRSRTTEHSYTTSSGRRGTRHVTWYTLYLRLADGRQLVVNTTTSLDLIDTCCQRITGEPAPEPRPESKPGRARATLSARIAAWLKAVRTPSAAGPPADDVQIGSRPLGDWILLLSSSEATARRDAALALARGGARAKRALPMLAAALGDSQADVRYAAALSISLIGPDEAMVPSLARAAGQRDEDARTRALAASALGALRQAGAPAIPGLRDALAHADADLRFQAAYALRRIGEPADPAVIGGLIAGLDRDRTRYLAASAIRDVGRPARDAVPRLVALLENPEAGDRTTVLEALGTMGQYAVAAVPVLITVLRDPDVNVRTTAAIVLGRIGPGATPALPSLREMEADEDDLARSMAEQAREAIERPGP